MSLVECLCSLLFIFFSFQWTLLFPFLQSVGGDIQVWNSVDFFHSDISSIHLHLDTCCRCPLWTFHLHFSSNLYMVSWRVSILNIILIRSLLSSNTFMCVTAPHSQLTFAVKSLFSGPLACSPSALLNVGISTHHLLPGLVRLSDCFH